MRYEEIEPGMRVVYRHEGRVTTVGKGQFQVTFDGGEQFEDWVYPPQAAEHFERLEPLLRPINAVRAEMGFEPAPENFSNSEPISVTDQVREQVAKLEPIEQEARRLVHGHRDQQYSPPKDNFTRIALIWSAVLGIDVTPEQVALCMNGLKLARLAHDPKSREGKVDSIGYILCLDWLQEEL